MKGLRSKIHLMGQNWWPKYYPNIQVLHSLFEPKGILLLQEHSQGSEGCIYVFILDSAHRKILAIHFWAIILVGMRFMQSEDRNKQHFLCISSICICWRKANANFTAPSYPFLLSPNHSTFGASKITSGCVVCYPSQVLLYSTIHTYSLKIQIPLTHTAYKLQPKSKHARNITVKDYSF